MRTRVEFQKQIRERRGDRISESIFLGTGSAEGVPNPLCSCPVCEKARKIRGKNLRLRSAFKLSPEILIDFGPDFVAQTQKYGGDLRGLKHVLITHTHYDHMSAFALCQFAGSIFPPQKPVRFYLTEDAFKIAEVMGNDSMLLNNGYREVLASGRIKFEKLVYFQEHMIGEYVVIPLPGRHPGTIEKRSANYLFKCPDNKVIYYATDTGYYYPETIEALKKYKVNILVTECTWGIDREYDAEDKHLSLKTIRPLLNELTENGIIGDFSKVYITHISHHQTMMYEELQDYVNQWKEFNFPIVVSYDGMTVER